MTLSNMSDHTKTIYQVAVFLNNVGVDLLKRNSFEAALSTLKDATSLMHDLFASQSSASPEILLTVQQMVQDANKRKAVTPFLRPMPSVELPGYRVTNLSDNHQAILSDNHGRKFVDSIYTIRIDDVSPEIFSPGGLNDPHAHASIMLHNLGLANLCVARRSHNANTRDLMTRQSMSIMQYSKTILERCYSDFEEDEIALRQAACINMAILVSLMRAMACCGTCFAEDAEEIMAELYSISSTVKALDRNLDLYTMNANCAPAA